MDIGEQGGVPSDAGVPRGVQLDVGGHHQSLMVVLGFIVDDDRVDRRPLDANWAMHSSVSHRVEGYLVWIVGALQDNLGSMIIGVHACIVQHNIIKY